MFVDVCWESNVMGPGVEIGVCGFFLVDEILQVFIPDDDLVLFEWIVVFGCPFP